jgi:hypothetical protein
MDLKKQVQLANDFNVAKEELKEMGELNITSVIKEDGEFYTVNLIKDGVEYTEEGYDAVLATIRLRNNFN